MKKILIIAYFFPPSNHTSAERAYSWAKYFKEFGYYPIIITRKWDVDSKIKNHDLKPSQSQGIEIQKESDYEVHYLPYKPDIGQRFFDRYAGTSRHLLYLIVFFLYRLLEPFFVFSLSSCYKHIYSYAKKMMDNNKSINSCIISAPPFIMYKIGYCLKKKFEDIDFIADYRDDWTTNEIFMNPNKKFFPGLLIRYERIFERKWLKAYTFFLSVSKSYVQKINTVINSKGYVMDNGYIKDNYTSLSESKSHLPTICYVGSLFPSQPIEIFLDAVLKVIREGFEMKVEFVGAIGTYSHRIEDYIKGFEQYFIFYPRIPKVECIRLQKQADVLLLISHNNLKGAPGSRIYEYLALKKPVLVCPTDNDIMEETLSASGQGIFVKTTEECYNVLKNLVIRHREGRTMEMNINQHYIEGFDRKNLTKKLAALIDAHTAK